MRARTLLTVVLRAAQQTVHVPLAAVKAGRVPTCALFIWRMGTPFVVLAHAQGELPSGLRVFASFGSLFFGAVGKIEALPAQLPEG